MIVPQNLVALLEQRVTECGDRVAFTYLVDGERTEENLTFSGLAERAKGVAATLQGFAKQGDRVVLLYPPGLEYISAFFGCLYGGFIAVPAYPPDPSRLNRTLPRLQAIVSDAGANVVLTTSPILAMTEVLATLAPDLGQKKWLATDGPELESASKWQPPQVRPETLAFLQYTSGSTGIPKGVMLTHGNLIANERMIQQVFKLTPESVGVGWLPLYHDMGLIGNVLQPIYTGFRCVLMSPLDFLHKPLRWLEAISRYHGTGSGAPNFAYDLCVRKVTAEDRQRLDLTSWKLAFSGAEPVRADTLDAFARTFAECGFRPEAFLPCYGLAEASLIVSGKTMGTPYRVAHLDARALEEGRATEAPASERRALVSNGAPVEGTQVHVVDPVARTVCGEGKIGEIWVAGPHVAQGYWRDSEKTETTFGLRISGTKGPTFLRTGDLGFFLNGELYVSGRLKDLIIIRGRNYYPQDIERVVEEAYPSLRRGCAAAFSVQVEGEERLVVAVEVERRVRANDRRVQAVQATTGSDRRNVSERRVQEVPGPAVDARTDFQPDEIFGAVRRAISEHFGVHVHAVALLKAGSIPKTSSGKIQRHLCCNGFLEGTLDLLAMNADEDSGSDVRLGVADLQSARTAERLKMLVEYLRVELARVMRVAPSRVDVDAPLNSLGLDSLMSVEIKHAIERSLGITLPVTAFLRDGSVASMAASILSGLRLTSSGAPPPPSSRPPRSTPPPNESPQFPLSAGQEALWFLQQLAPKSSAYHLSTAFRVKGELVPAVAESALRALVARHPALHTTYADVGGRPVQTVRPELVSAFQLPVYDGTSWSDAQLARNLAELGEAPFDLSAGPVFRAALVRRGPNEHILHLCVHHIAADLWSIVLLLSELQTVYPAIRAGRGLPTQLQTGERYRDFVTRQRQYLDAEGELDWDYWRGQLAGVADLDLPTDRPRPRVQTYAGAAHKFAFDAKLTAELTEFARREGVTLYVVLLAAFQALLARYSGQSSFVVGSPVVGRPSGAYDRVVGYFVNALPMRADLGGDPTVRELLQKVRGTVLLGLEHQNFPFPTAVERLRVHRDPSRSPLFQVMFALEKSYLEQESDVTMLVLEATDKAIAYMGLTLASTPIVRRTAQFDLTLNVAQAAGALSGLFEYNTDLFEPATIDRMAKAFDVLLRAAIGSPEAKVRTLPLLDADSARAVVRDWNATATPYPTQPLVPDLIEAQVDRTPNAVAVAFEGGTVTYRQLDEMANRLAHAIRARGVGPNGLVAVFMERSIELVAALLAVEKAGAAYVPIDPAYPSDRIAFMLDDSGAHVVVTQRHLRASLPADVRETIEADADLSAFPPARPRRALSPRSSAYMIYTSGSTGRPKGALNSHGGLLNRLQWMQSALKLGPTDAVLQKTSFSFDVSVWEFFWPLLVGARLVVARPEGHKDAAYLCDLIKRERVTTVHFVPSMLKAFLDEPRARACTELRRVVCSGEALPYELARRFHEQLRAELHNLYGPTEAAIDVTWWPCRPDAPGPSLPIGRPIANTQMYVLDRAMQPVPIGVAGELFIGGVQLAHGYWRRPDLTAERFVPNPFGGGDRLYRTGDLAKWRPDGAIEYLGRLDHQVKLRGFRIELGEIESVLRSHAGVRDAIVITREMAAGDPRILAYVVGNVTASELRKHVGQRLPEYMMPSSFVMMERFPLTPNGKVDRAALPAPNGQTGRASYVPPATPPQEAMCAIAAELLHTSSVGIHDNFFDLGGHSLLATQFVSRVRTTLHVEIAVSALFEHPTIAQLSRAYFENSVEGEI